MEKTRVDTLRWCAATAIAVALTASTIFPAAVSANGRPRPDGQEPGPAGLGLERPTPVDQVGGDGADDEAEGLGQVDLEPDDLVEQYIKSEVDDGRQPAGDDESHHLRLEAQRATRY